MTVRRRLMLALLLGGAACGSGPVSGNFTVSYVSPGQTDGALLLLVTGAVSSVKSVGSWKVASAAAGPTTTRVVVTGTLSGGDILTIAVPDTSALSGYSVKVEAVADRNTYALGDLSLYSATVRK